MNPWIGVVITAVATLAALISAAITLLNFKRNNRRKRLEYRIICGRKGHNYPDLYTATVILVNPCKANIKAADFDGGKPLKIRLGTPLTHTLIPDSVVQNWPRFQITGHGDEDGMAIMKASLVTSMAVIHGFVFTANPPTPTATPSLGDIPVLSGADATGRRRKLRWWAGIMIFLALFWAVASGLSWMVFATDLWAIGGYAQVLAQFLAVAAGMGVLACLTLLAILYLRDHVLDRHINQQVAKFQSLLEGPEDYFDTL